MIENFLEIFLTFNVVHGSLSIWLQNTEYTYLQAMFQLRCDLFQLETFELIKFSSWDCRNIFKFSKLFWAS